MLRFSEPKFGFSFTTYFLRDTDQTRFSYDLNWISQAGQNLSGRYSFIMEPHVFYFKRNRKAESVLINISGIRISS